MASLAKDHGGAWRVLVIVNDKRQTIRLGRIPRETADKIRVHIQSLAAAREYAVMLDGPTEVWLRTVSDDFHKRLVEVGLTEPRRTMTLKQFVDEYQAKRTKDKPWTKKNVKAMCDNLIEHFGDGRPLASITHDDADGFRLWLIGQQYAKATWGQFIKKARSCFATAIKPKLIETNPFVGVHSPEAVNPQRKQFIERSTIDRIMSVTDDYHWRTVIALSRYGGLRCPSEHLDLRWQDIDWKTGRITIAAHKTKERVIPIFPALRPYLVEHREHSAGSQYVIERCRDSSTNWRGTIIPLIYKAGLEPWPKLFTNLRGSHETELAAEHPIAVAAEWVGNSALVAQKHYLSVRHEDFTKALAQISAHAPSTETPTQHAEPSTVQRKPQPGRNTLKTLQLDCPRQDSNLRPPV